MMRTALKALSLLLSYPEEDLHDAIPELIEAIGASSLDARDKTALCRLARDIGRRDLYDAQERYVLLFDRTRSLSLHLFEHVHGESRDRGQAMVDLRSMYEEDGYEIDVKELPDYLPMFLEFVSTKSQEEAANLLDQTSHIIGALRARLKKRKSVYVNAFAVLESISRQPDAARVQDLLKIPDDDPDDLEALDRIWEEETVTFGGNAGDNACGPDRLQRQVRASNRAPAVIRPLHTDRGS